MLAAGTLMQINAELVGAGANIMLAKGTLVQVKESALDSKDQYGDSNKTTVEAHGWLWIVDEVEEEDRFDGTTLYSCRSLATGGVAHWFNTEIEAAPKEQAE